MSALTGPSAGNTTDTIQQQGKKKCIARSKIQLSEQRHMLYSSYMTHTAAV
jgi:hypothetical protein